MTMPGPDQPVHRDSRQPRTIETKAGTFDLVPATREQLSALERYWPMGIRDIVATQDGLVFQQGDRELFGIKFQHVDRPEPLARTVHFRDRLILASALPFYLEHRHRGVMVPCPYFKNKPSGLVETGITYFVGPDAASRDLYRGDRDTLFDAELGVGATAMISHMALSVVRASKELGIPLDYFLSHEHRPRLAVGMIALYLAIQGSDLIVIKSPIRDEDPTWAALVLAGLSPLPYHPMVPAATAADGRFQQEPS